MLAEPKCEKNKFLASAIGLIDPGKSGFGPVSLK